MNDVEAASGNKEALMSPEEMALLKKLQGKQKAMKQAMGSVRESLFQTLTTKFGAAISKVKKDVVTITTKTAVDDGNIYSISMGVVEKKDEEGDVDTAGLASEIIDSNLATIDSLMGISSSMRVAGTFEGKELFWSIRKRAA